MHQVALVGYLFSTVTTVFLLSLLSSIWRGRFSGILLWLTVFVHALWSSAALAFHWQPFPLWLWLYELLDVARYLLLLLLLHDLLKPISQQQNKTLYWLKFKSAWMIIWAIVFLSKFIPVISVVVESFLFINLHLFGMLVFSLYGLVLTEQLFRHTRQELRWAIKFFCLGFGLLFAFDFYLFSDGLLFSRVRSDIEAARGYLSLIVWPMVAVAIARNPKWNVELFVSRSLAVRSAAVLFAGIYLLLMAIAGYYLKTSESEWGEALLIVFVFSAVALLIAFGISGSFRSRIRLLINKHFFASQYDYREEWLAFTKQLSEASTHTESFLTESLKAIAGVTDSPGGLLWIKDNHNNFECRSRWCMRQPPVEHDLSEVAAYLESAGWIVELTEYKEQPERYEGLVLPEWLIQMPLCWAIVPLMMGDELVGIVVLATPRASRRINWEDRDLLKTAGEQLAGYVKLYSTTLDLVDAKQFEAFNRLSAFVVHDLKNVCAQLSLITTNAVKHKSNPEFVDDAFNTVENAVKKMSRTLSHLRKDRVEAITTEKIRLLPVLNNVVETRKIELPIPALEPFDEAISVIADREKLIEVLNHLVQNAQEASEDGGSVTLSVVADTQWVSIHVTDNGCGMSEDFLKNRLFKPFDTTKGNAGMGIGVYQSKETINSFGGSLVVASEQGKGTQFTIRLINGHREK